MDGFTLNVLVSINSMQSFLFFTLEFFKLQNDLQMPRSNLDSRSSTATMYYHKTSFLLIQVHSEESESTVPD